MPWLILDVVEALLTGGCVGVVTTLSNL